MSVRIQSSVRRTTLFAVWLTLSQFGCSSSKYGEVLPPVTKDAGADSGKEVKPAACKPGEKRECYSGPSTTLKIDKAPCKAGSQVCDGRDWGPCIGQVLPKDTDYCFDDIDDDCNGVVDDKCYCSGPEVCRTFNPVNEGIGECASGKRACLLKALGRVCEDEKRPVQEICDGKDNDCDGKIDNGVAGGCSCNNGEKRQCYSGNGAKAGKGECRFGVQECSAGRWGACQGEVIERDETCDGKDNDCDGVVDNGFSGGGACSTGLKGAKVSTERCSFARALRRQRQRL
jgi:Putative metal-binding motif